MALCKSFCMTCTNAYLFAPRKIEVIPQYRLRTHYTYTHWCASYTHLLCYLSYCSTVISSPTCPRHFHRNALAAGVISAISALSQSMEKNARGARRDLLVLLGVRRNCTTAKNVVCHTAMMPSTMKMKSGGRPQIRGNNRYRGQGNAPKN